MTNRLYCGDNLVGLAQLPAECVNLIYIDPPFFSKRSQTSRLNDRSPGAQFDDRWAGGLDEYIEWMRVRVVEMHRVLKSTGSFYLHCDWHAGHYLKVMCDGVFGRERFQNEIIWCYRTGGASRHRWSRKHDSIFFYTKSAEYTFNLIKERVFYDKPFFSETRDAEGRWHADVHPVDWWVIPAVLNLSKERLDYPTQKPVELLEKIIQASSNPGDLVLDAFCGSGTALVAAQKLGRRWVGMDVSEEAIGMAKGRLEELGVEQIEVMEV